MNSPYRETTLVPVPEDTLMRPFTPYKRQRCPYCGAYPDSGPPVTCFGNKKNWDFMQEGKKHRFVEACEIQPVHLHQYCVVCKGTWHYRTAEQEEALLVGLDTPATPTIVLAAGAVAGAALLYVLQMLLS